MRDLAAVLTPTLAILLVIAFQPAAGRAEPAEERLWLEARDASGKTVRDLVATDVTVVQGGTEVPQGSVRLLFPRQRSAEEPALAVIYFDTRLAGSGTLRASARGLDAVAGRLSELGEVTVVIAEEAPRQELTTREVGVLKERLTTATLGLQGDHGVLEARRRAFDDLERLSPSAERRDPRRAAEVVSRAIAEELALLRRRSDLMLSWLAGLDDAHPRLLLWVTDGFDLDPRVFYDRHLIDPVMAAVEPVAGFRELAETTARTLAADGWTVVPVVLEVEDTAPRAVEPTAILFEDPLGQEDPPGGLGIKIRPKRAAEWWRERRGDEEGPPEPALFSPLEPLELAAGESGGLLVTAAEGLGPAVEGLLDRYELAYAVPERAELGARAVELRPRRAGLALRARRWVSRGAPVAMTDARLRRLLAGEEPSSDLGLEALLRLEELAGSLPEEAEIEVLLDLRDLGPGGAAEKPRLGSATLVITTAAALAAGEPKIERRVLRDRDLGGFDSWHHRFALSLPPGAVDLAVSVEVLDLGLWAGGRVEGVVLEEEDREGDLLEARPAGGGPTS